MASSVKSAYGNALSALKGFLGDPVGRLPPTYESLGDGKARRIGLTYGVVSLLCFLLGGYLLIPFRDGLFGHLGVGGVLKAVVFAAIPFGCAALGGLATRKLFGGTGGGPGGDCFVAGAALLPRFGRDGRQRPARARAHRPRDGALGLRRLLPACSCSSRATAASRGSASAPRRWPCPSSSCSRCGSAGAWPRR
jgi:hypothetical protein